MIAKGISPYTWEKEPNLDSFIPLEKFDQKPSLTSSVMDCNTLLEFFNFLINNQMVNLIVESTNNKIELYAREKSYLNKKSIEPVSPTEIRAYFGLLLLFGVLKKSRVAISEIWAEDSKENIHHCSYATSTMSRDRFKIISCCISFDNIQTREERKVNDPKFFKMREIFDLFRQNIKQAFEPGYYLCVDETL